MNKILLPAIIGTSVMTLFSHIIADVENKNFSEPELLAQIHQKILPQITKELALPLGWITHYSVGVMFTILFYLIRKNPGIKPAIKSSISLGILSGLASIVVWKVLLKALPKRSHKFYNRFYTQLFAAHLIFAIAVIQIQSNRQIIEWLSHQH